MIRKLILVMDNYDNIFSRTSCYNVSLSHYHDIYDISYISCLVIVQSWYIHCCTAERHTLHVSVQDHPLVGFDVDVQGGDGEQTERVVPTLAERIAADVSKIMQDIYGMSTIQPYHENYDCIQSLYHVISYYNHIVQL